MENQNFGEAVKVKIKKVKSKTVVQKIVKTPPSICIVKDSLANVKVDAIACTTSHGFNLSRGAVSAALLRQGGDDLQKELYKKCSGAQNFDEVIPVSGYKLDCRVVFFGVMYPYNSKYKKGHETEKEYYQSNIRDFLQKCLNLAEKRQLRSVAFPAIGAGVLKYPLDIVFDEMFRTVNNWLGKYVKEVKFVIYPKDTVVLQEFERPLKKYGTSTVPCSEIRHSGSMRTSQFNKLNRDSQVGLPKVVYKFPLPKGYTTEFIEMCCADVISSLECDVSFTKHELIIKFTLEVFEIGKTVITDVLKNMQKEYPIYDFLDLTQGEFNLHDVRKKIEEIEKCSKVRCSVSNNGTSVNFFGKIVQDVKYAKNKIVSLLPPPRRYLEQNSPKETKDAGSKFVIYPKDTSVSQEFEIAGKNFGNIQVHDSQSLPTPPPRARRNAQTQRPEMKKLDHSLLLYGQANDTGQMWNSRVLTRSLNRSAGQTMRTMKYGKQSPTASDDKSGMKQKKYYLEKDNEEKTAQTVGTGREDFILEDGDDDDDDKMCQSSMTECKTLKEKKDYDLWIKYHKRTDFSPKETYSGSNQTCPNCDTKKPDQIIGQRKSSNMSETSKEKSYEVKKVGKVWLLGRSGGTLKKCPLLTNAEEVDKSDNFIAADDQVYEIKEDEFEQVYLVSVEETPIYHHNNNNRKTSQSRQGESISPSSSQKRSRAWFQSHQQETLPQYAKELNEMTITDGSEIGKNEDQYYLLEAGQTEDSSLIEIGFPAKQ